MVVYGILGTIAYFVILIPVIILAIGIVVAAVNRAPALTMLVLIGGGYLLAKAV